MLVFIKKRRYYSHKKPLTSTTPLKIGLYGHSDIITFPTAGALSYSDKTCRKQVILCLASKKA